jgi:dienelactone hydrolase
MYRAPGEGAVGSNAGDPTAVQEGMETRHAEPDGSPRRVLHAAARVLAVTIACSAPAAGQAPPPLPEPIGIEVRFPSGADTLDGSLLLPPGPGPHPAVVAIEGSGGYSFRRHWRTGAVPFWKSIAEHLVGRGYAVLLFDKPGVHRSTGDWRRQRFEDRAREALAAVAFLAAWPGIDGGRIGLIGHSQGGWIAQLAAADAADRVRFLVTLSGPSVSVRQQVLDDNATEWDCARSVGFGRAVRSAGMRAGLWTLGLVARVATPGYLARVINYDPRPALARITQPMLALFGGNDRLVYPETNVPRLRAEFGRTSGNAQLWVRVVRGADHGFGLYPRCGGADVPPRFAPGFFAALDDPAFWGAVASGSAAAPRRGPGYAVSAQNLPRRLAATRSR